SPKDESMGQKGPDVRLVDIFDRESSSSLKYLMVKLVDNEGGGQRDNFNDIRNLGKRRQQDWVDTPNKKGRLRKTVNARQEEPLVFTKNGNKER
ncbi:11384_t:CDS:1, partial [Racocetra fulgida]